MFLVGTNLSMSLPLPLFPLFLSHCYCIDHNNVSGDTPFHGHSSETELHKPFTTRSPWWMAGPPAKAPRPDRSAFLRDKYRQKDIRRVPFFSFWMRKRLGEEEEGKKKDANKHLQGFWHTLHTEVLFCFGLFSEWSEWLWLSGPAHMLIDGTTRRWSWHCIYVRVRWCVCVCV